MRLFSYIFMAAKKEKKKLSLKEVKKIPPHLLLRLINKAKSNLKNDPTMIDICKKYNQPIEIIDLIPTYFANIDTSARTNHGIVILNYKLLCDGDFHEDYGYLIHEYTHYFQQTCNEKPTKSSDDGEYLDNPYEIEGFQNQTLYIAQHQGEDKAEEYIENLLDHHDIDSNPKREKKEEQLMAKV
jgi:hypothetical protein